MEVDGGQINDKVAIMQEWLFSESLPNFSRNDTIIEYLTSDESLEYFFKFIVTPFKSIIHHIVREGILGSYGQGQEKIWQARVETQHQSQENLQDSTSIFLCTAKAQHVLFPQPEDDSLPPAQNQHENYEKLQPKVPRHFL